MSPLFSRAAITQTAVVGATKELIMRFYKLAKDKKGLLILKEVETNPNPGQRGMWVSIGHENDQDIKYVYKVNVANGLYPVKDEKGFYRVCVLRD
jgi:hypothetical protein